MIDFKYPHNSSFIPLIRHKYHNGSNKDYTHYEFMTGKRSVLRFERRFQSRKILICITYRL